MSMTSVIPAVFATTSRGVGMTPATSALRSALSVSFRICLRASSSSMLLFSALLFLDLLDEVQDLFLLARGHVAQRP